MSRLLQEKDLPAVTLVCNRAMPLDHFFVELLHEKTFGDNNYDKNLNLVEENDGAIVGFASGVVRQRKGEKVGFTKLLAVNPDFREKGIGFQLLSELEAKFRELGCVKARIMDSAPNYFMPGLDYRYTEGTCLLQKAKYTRDGVSLNLIADLQYFPIDHSEEIRQCEEKGVQIRRALPSDKEASLAMVAREWTSWIPEVEATFRHDPVTLFIGLKDNQVVGFSAYDSNNVRTGWFGPMGVLPEYRKFGIGQIVCKLCLAEIKKQGFHTSVIPWVGPVRFYSKVCGARNDRTFWTYEKEL